MTFVSDLVDRRLWAYQDAGGQDTEVPAGNRSPGTDVGETDARPSRLRSCSNFGRIFGARSAVNTQSSQHKRDIGTRDRQWILTFDERHARTTWSEAALVGRYPLDRFSALLERKGLHIAGCHPAEHLG